MNIDDIIESAQMKGRIIALEAEVSSLNAAIRAHERVDCLTIKSLKDQLNEASRKIHGLQQDNEFLQNRVDLLEPDKS